MRYPKQNSKYRFLIYFQTSFGEEESGYQKSFLKFRKISFLDMPAHSKTNYPNLYTVSGFSKILFD